MAVKTSIPNCFSDCLAASDKFRTMVESVLVEYQPIKLTMSGNQWSYGTLEMTLADGRELDILVSSDDTKRYVHVNCHADVLMGRSNRAKKVREFQYA
jgi:hypothetical protein